jgi:glucosamine--fructose-6-phosphate aminotransferase (isomerizing)
MRETVMSQPAELRRMLDDTAGVVEAARRLAGRRVLLVGTGTSWHAANAGAWFLRAADFEAVAVQAVDAALHGPRPTGEEGLILLSHRGTKQYTSQVLEGARAAGNPTVVISGRGAPGADIETVEQERSSAFTASHTGAMLRLAQIAVELGADLGPLDAVPGLVETVVGGPSLALTPPARSLEFIGAGPNQWTAAEGALKVRETAYVAAAGWSAEQYLHGPFVASGPSDALVCLNSRGPAQERLLAIARGAESCGVAVRVIMSDAPTELLSVFPLTAVVQMIALETAETLGTDPDTFGRNLPSRAHALDGIPL